MTQKNDATDNASSKSSPVEEKSKPLNQKLRVQDQLKALEAERDEALELLGKHKDDYVRAVAELQNTRNRHQKELANAHKFGLERFAQALLPVLDSLEKALEAKHDNESVKAIREGTELTLKLFLDAVAKFGLEPIDPVGAPFDPNHHEALSMLPNAEAEPNTVIEMIQRGYLLNGRLVRPARVIVAA